MNSMAQLTHQWGPIDCRQIAVHKTLASYVLTTQSRQAFSNTLKQNLAMKNYPLHTPVAQGSGQGQVCEGGMHDQVQEHIAMALVQDAAWLGGGDWNQTPSENLVATAGHVYAAADGSGGFAPTRWNGARCIDYYVAFDGRRGNHLDVRAEFLPFRISDHKGVELVHRYEPLVSVGFTPVSTPDLDKPAGIDTGAWRAALHAAWARCEAPEDDNPEAAWREFNQMATWCHEQALAACGQGIPSSDGTRPKGSSPTFRGGPSKVRREKPHTFKLRKLSAWVGRLQELVFQQSRQQACSSLYRKVWRTWLREIPWSPDLCTVLRDAQVLLEERRKDSRRKGLATWKESMAKEGKACTRWLKQDYLSLPVGISTPQGCATTVPDIFSELRRAWKAIWERDGTCEELTRLRAVGDPPGDEEWLLTPSQLLAAAKAKQAGAPGPDGWSGAEVSHWPEHAWSIYVVLWNRWAQNDDWPSQLREYRQIFLPKKAQVDDARELEAFDLRPISSQPGGGQCHDPYSASKELDIRLDAARLSWCDP